MVSVHILFQNLGMSPRALSISQSEEARLGSHAVAGKQQRYTQLLNRAMQDDNGRQVGYHPALPALWARDLGWQLRA